MAKLAETATGARRVKHGYITFWMNRAGAGAAGAFYSGAGARAEIVTRSQSRPKVALLRIPGHAAQVFWLILTK